MCTGSEWESDYKNRAPSLKKSDSLCCITGKYMNALMLPVRIKRAEESNILYMFKSSSENYMQYDLDF